MLAIPRALVSEPMNTCVPGRPSRSWSLCSAVLRKNGASRWIAIRSRHAATGTAVAAARYCVPAACTMPSSGPPVAPLALAISWPACSRSATSAGQRDDAAGRVERGGLFQLGLGPRDGHHAAAGRRDRQRHGAAEASPGAGDDVGPPGQAELARGLVCHLCTVPSIQIIESQDRIIDYLGMYRNEGAHQT